MNPDSQVMCWSDALPPHGFERKLIIPLGAIPTKNFTVLCLVQPSESLNFNISDLGRSINISLQYIVQRRFG